jgi:hypothetical protein
MRDHYEIPSTFDGENPAFAFSDPDAPPRLKFGEIYAVPDHQGREIPARLRDALVVETEKSVFGMYETLDGHYINVTCPLTDAEIEAWKRHPNTFFGEVREANNRRAKNRLELAMFFYETYKHTTKEILLEWMTNAVDIDHLKTLPQQELAIIYCERLGLGAKEFS